MSKLLEVNDNSFNKEVFESEGPVLVDFSAPWCGQCKIMEPILEEVADIMSADVKLVKVNCASDDSAKLVEEHEIFSLPTIKLFFQGEIVGAMMGMRGKESIIEETTAMLNKLKESK